MAREDDLYAEMARLRQGLARLAPNTVMGYGYDWAMFTAWTARMDRAALPATPDTVALYLTDLLLSGKKVSTAHRRCCAIACQHRGHGYASPVSREVRELLCGAQRIRGEKPRQMRPITVAELRALSVALECRGTALALRDRSLLVLGFAGALRRSSIAALRLDDVEHVPQGLVLSIRREKQDQEGRGRLIGIPWGEHPETCPVRCLRAWLDRRGALPGPLGPLFIRLDRGHFGMELDGDCIYRIVKKRLAQIGLDVTDMAPHSFRAGFITEAGEHGIGEWLIASQTGHRSMAVLRRYFRRSDLWKANAAAQVGL